MNVDEILADRFEANRPRLLSVAYRMLGSASQADDAVQEAWLRLNRTDATDIDNLGGWLTTVVARVCLDMLRSREARREESLPVSESYIETDAPHPEHEALLADSVGLALLVVLDTLNPDERLAFVLHDLFAVSFEEIAPIVGRTPAAARQLASRARRRVQGATVPDDDLARRRRVVDAFLAASRGGDFEGLVALLHPDAVVRADAVAVSMGAEREARGAAAVARTFTGRATAARPALIDGALGAVWSQGGRPRVAFLFRIEEGKISAIDLLADPERLARLDLITELR